jgi:hypothetical protein
MNYVYQISNAVISMLPLKLKGSCICCLLQHRQTMRRQNTLKNAKKKYILPEEKCAHQIKKASGF